MNKAFTKEDSSQDLDLQDEDDEKDDLLPQGFKNYITVQGADRLKEELRSLLTEQRPEVVRTVSWAASNGDRSENGDYIYGKRKLREIDRRIRFLQKRLDSAEIVNNTSRKTDQVLFGALVRVSDEEGRLRAYRIVGVDETNPKSGAISWISPMAKALLNAKVGDAVVVKTPKGEEELEILSVEYP